MLRAVFTKSTLRTPLLVRASRGLRTVPNAILNQLQEKGIRIRHKSPLLVYQPSVPELYTLGVNSVVDFAKPVDAEDSVISNMGAMCAYSGAKTGRTPKDKRIVEEDTTKDKVWWGDVNIPLSEESFAKNRARGLDYINTRRKIYIFDGYAGWDPKYRIKVRVIATRAYHTLFMHNMLIRPTERELATFEEQQPDFYIYNSGEFPADPLNDGVTSTTSVALNMKAKEVVILGTQYAGEMKKGVFTLMHYLMPQQGVLSLHASANEGEDGDTTLLFGLSGTGKTTLSADPKRKLIGDDEHCWSDTGIFNIEGGCYAKCNGLSHAKEPDIWNAIKFGSVLENVRFGSNASHEVDFDNISVTENTRLSYPIEAMANAKIPCIGGHPKNIIFLTCDAFGVLPPVSKLTKEQAMYHFIAGYTAKVAGTEEGVTEPTATFSACFGEAFLMLHPTQYADMLAEKMNQHDADAWLVNTGWTGGAYGVGERMSLKHTRAIIDAIHSGELREAETEKMDIFNLEVPVKCSGVPSETLHPKRAWGDMAKYEATVRKLAKMFNESFKKYEDRASEGVKKAGPQL